MQNIEELKTCLPGAILQLDKQWIDVEYSHLTKLIFALKSKFNFCQLIDITAIDKLNNSFEILYILRNLDKNEIIHVKTTCHESAYSITNIFQNADLYECEIYEMFGIRFLNHPNLRPIFSDSLGYLLRKSNG